MIEEAMGAFEKGIAIWMVAIAAGGGWLFVSNSRRSIASKSQPPVTTLQAQPPASVPQTQATVAIPQSQPPVPAPQVQSAVVAPSRMAEPVNLRCANMSVREPNPGAYYALVTVDLDGKKITQVMNYPGGTNTVNYNIVSFNDQKIDARSVGGDVERLMVFNRLSGRIEGKVNGKFGWISLDFDCQPAKRVL